VGPIVLEALNVVLYVAGIDGDSPVNSPAGETLIQSGPVTFSKIADPFKALH
jgi:hypothetical protein